VRERQPLGDNVEREQWLALLQHLLRDQPIPVRRLLPLIRLTRPPDRHQLDQRSRTNRANDVVDLRSATAAFRFQFCRPVGWSSCHT
jgi:hypothetical protein